MNPFDIKAALTAKHAQHVVLIHFPIALFIAGAAFDYVAQATKKRIFESVAFYNIVGAAIFALPVVATGLLAWQWQLEGQKLKGILLLHLLLGCASTILIWLVMWSHVRARRKPEHSRPVLRLTLEALAVVIVTLTGHLGGFLSGTNSPG